MDSTGVLLDLAVDGAAIDAELDGILTGIESVLAPEDRTGDGPATWSPA